MVQAEILDTVRQTPYGSSTPKSDLVVTEKELSSIELSLERRVEHWSRHLVVSPYTEKEHLLDLDTLDSENQLLAEALVHFRCLRDDYATSPYLETFNWPEVIDRVRELALARHHSWKETSFYIVAFRSQIQGSTVYADLGLLDKAAHAEATASGGFLKCVVTPPVADNKHVGT
jgi:translation initiation factor 3 subunit H